MYIYNHILTLKACGHDMYSITLLLTCWLSSVKVRSVFMTSSAFAASIIPAVNPETPTHATEYARTCKNMVIIFIVYCVVLRCVSGGVVVVQYLLQHASLSAAVLQVAQQFVQSLGDVDVLLHLSTAAQSRQHQTHTQHTASTDGGDTRN